mgnify:CR=1 FL=1
MKLLSYILLYLKTLLLSVLYSTILKDRSATRIGNSLLIPYYYNGVWDCTLVPYTDHSKDQYTIVKYYDCNDRLILNYTVPKGMSLLVNETDLKASRCTVIADLEDE